MSINFKQLTRRHSLILATGFIVLVAALALYVKQAHALGFTAWLDVSKNVETGSCKTSIINIDFRLTKGPDISGVGDFDGDGNDYGIMVIYDGTGEAIYTDKFTNGGKHLYSIAIGWWKTPTARPLTIVVYDVDFVVTSPDSSDAQVADAETGTILSYYVYDPGVDFSVCADLPYIGGVDTSSPEEENPEPWYYSPAPSTPDFTFALQQTPFEGQTACGVFEPRWWGVKFILPGNFPACNDLLPDGVQIACMNNTGEWVTSEVKDEHINEGTFQATVYQHGACGIFPKPADEVPVTSEGDGEAQSISE